jgi:hypothetical protein
LGVALMSKFNPRQTLGTDDDTAGAESMMHEHRFVSDILS